MAIYLSVRRRIFNSVFTLWISNKKKKKRKRKYEGTSYSKTNLLLTEMNGHLDFEGRKKEYTCKCPLPFFKFSYIHVR